MLTKKEKKTQKKLLEQREVARAQSESLTSEVERLKGDVNVLAAEEIRKATAASAELLRVAEAERGKAVRERDALLKDFDAAIAARLDETAQELEATKAKLAAAQKQVLGLVQRNNAQGADILGLTEKLKMVNEREAKMATELASLKLEDTKQLRKRLQSKSERVVELEREVKELKSRPATGTMTPAVAQLSAMLNAKLRKKLVENGQLPTDLTAPAAPVQPAQP